MFLQEGFSTILHFETIIQIMLQHHVPRISTMIYHKLYHDIQVSNHENMHPTWVSMISFFIKKCKMFSLCHALACLSHVQAKFPNKS
jgi:hypothetical protein